VKKDYQTRAVTAATTAEMVVPDVVSVAMAELTGAVRSGAPVEPAAVLDVADGVLDLGVAAVIGFEFEGRTRSGERVSITLSKVSAIHVTCARLNRGITIDISRAIGAHENPELVAVQI
jgi:hypothetical protein